MTTHLTWPSTQTKKGETKGLLSDETLERAVGVSVMFTGALV